MKPWRLGLLCVWAALCACPGSKDSAGGSVRLDKLGVSLKIPGDFQPVPENKLADMEKAGVTVLPVEPFTVIPRYGYAHGSGKGIIIISELRFGEGVTPQKYPMDNIFIYRNNLAAWFGVDEINNEDIQSGDITTVLLAMTFTEGGDDISLFKGLCYIYPRRFFMIDLYVFNSRITAADAAGFQNMFYSIGLL